MEAKAKSSEDEIVFGGSLMHSAEPDFSGYATKAGIRCADGRTIMPDAFKDQDQMTVPLVWQHNHNTPENVLGHAVLENRNDGVYAYGYFNDTPQGKQAKMIVEHKDVKSLSIYANKLKEQASKVLHGIIREVSIVISGANPEAFIDNIQLQHDDGGLVTIDDEAIIYPGVGLDDDDDDVEHSTDDPTVQEIYDTFNDDQKKVVHFMIGAAIEDQAQTLKQSATDDDDDDDDDDESELSHNSDKKKGRHMKRNVFEQQNEDKEEKETHELTHDAMKGIFEDAQRLGTLHQAVEAYALKHGINDLEILFPDAKAVSATPDFDKRRTEWVAGVLNGTKHSPFSRIKSLVADITHDEARARGYIKGTFKKEEWYGLAKRITTPSTIYKKQKLDRDDILDIVDFDVVTWMKGEMRLMLEEELARAILIGDGRDVDDEDKIKDPVGANEGAGIRSIINDHELYAATVTVNVDDASSSPQEVVDEIIRSFRFYKGSGSPTLYTTLSNLTYMLLARDGVGRRLYRTASDLAAELGVSSIVPVEVMEGEDDLFGIIVNLSDYTIGSDKGGETNFFDDFDLDYNQYKYLYETRLSGALTKIRSALIVRKTAGANVLVAPDAPDFDGTDIHINDTAGVVYKRGDTNAVVTSAADVTLAAGDSLRIYATPAAGYYFESNQEDEWTFTNEA